MAYYAKVIDSTVVAVIESKVSQPGYLECNADVLMGWLYNGSEFSAPPATQPQPEVVIVGLAINGTQQITVENRVIISAGQSLAVVSRIVAGGQVMPVTDTFAVPISRVRGDVDQTVRVQFINGEANFSVAFPRSGEYAVLPEWLNMYLPADKQLAFQPFYISVTV